MSFYKHKSGYQKRKLKEEKEEKTFSNTQVISKFFKPKEAEKNTHSIETIPVENENIDIEYPAKKPILIENISKKEICEHENTKDLLTNNTDMHDLFDPGLWPEHINDDIRQQIIATNLSNFDNIFKMRKAISKDCNGKIFSEFLLYTKSSNNREKYPRDWLIYSSSKKTLHCFPCLLFSENLTESIKSRSVLAKRSGFSPKTIPWKKLYSRLPLHENSETHRTCYCKWKNVQQSLFGFGVDNQLQKKILSEAEKRKAILKRLLDVTLFLASRGLPFQGSSTKIGEVNNGNFLGILELLGRYDEVTRDHLATVEKYQNKGESMKGKTHYLSWMSQNEFISLCGEKVLSHILNERIRSIYYGVIVDATPDVSHQEQNVLILRYVLYISENKKFEIKERFIEFLNFNEKTGESIASELLKALERHKIPLADCRAQAYDNGANMSGKIKGVQARILEKNHLALYSPCSAHSLNLVGVNAVKINSRVKTFFGCVQTLYVTFSSSPAKWSILNEEVSISLESQSETRWSSRVSAIRPIVHHLPGILKSLDRILNEINLPEKMYCEIISLKNYFSSFECIAMASFWFKILSSINERNVIIQSRGISLETEIDLMNDLIKELQNIRNEWHIILNEAKLVASDLNILPNFQDKEKRTKKRKVFHDEGSSETDIQPSTESIAHDSFRRDVIFASIDFIITDLTHRFEAHKKMCDLFSPILCYMKLSSTELEIKLKEIIKIYSDDLSPNILNELLHLRKIHKSVFLTEIEIPPLKLLNEIYIKKLENIFINTCIALRIFCTLPVTVSEAERAFSKLGNQLKTWQRASIGQERLNALGILSIEHKLASSINFDDIIHDFAQKKARKEKFS